MFTCATVYFGTSLDFVRLITMLENEIRILDILPYGNAGPQGPIQCEIRIAALSDKPVYDALSYRWGDPEKKRHIQVDSQRTYVTVNLYAALHRLRRENETRSIWIDQLCIDQSNKAEKAVQVRMMGEIYCNCSQCLIWMDEINDSIPQADAESILKVLSWIADRSLPVPTCLASVCAFRGPIQALSSISVDVHPWWERIWTIQEAILPPKKLILWGPLELPWDTLTKCAGVWLGTGSDEPADEITEFTSLMGAASTELVKSFQTMEWLLCNVAWIDSASEEREEPVVTAVKWSCRKATDSRDKVFGLLGLLPSDMELCHTKQCDYGTAAAEVYSAFTLDMVLHTESLLPLVIIQPPESSGKVTAKLPSWVCDMDCEVPNQVDIVYRISEYDSYDACAGRNLDRDILDNEDRATTSHCPIQTLRLKGAKVDTIEMIGTKIPALQVSVKIAQTLRSWMHMGRKFHETLRNGLSEQRFREAFFRVLVSDRIRNEGHCVVRRPNEDDLANISDFVHTGHGLVNDLQVWDNYVCNRTFFITQNGIMGLGHLDTEPRDEVWVFDGGKMPLTIRARGGESRDEFVLIGCCYAHGIMDGEAFQDKQTSAGVPKRTIRLH